MYPDFHYLIQSIFGIDIPALGIIKTFGFFVAMGFLAGAMVMKAEFKRKTQQGIIPPQIRVNPKTGAKEVFLLENQVMDIIFMAAIGGFIGAKVFNAFETWDYFIQNPIDSLFSRSGFTFYGGLIVATGVLYYYARKNKIDFRQMCDAAAPALILAYGIGRLGCHFSGDGDWGIYNSAYITQANGDLQLVEKGEFEKMTAQYQNYFKSFDGNVPHLYVPDAPLPLSMYANNYIHNVNNDGMTIAGDTGEYNSVLPAAVFPTAFWEFIACSLIIFPFLWSLRNRLNRPLQMFGVYLIFNGLERFLVEKIRVNYKYDWGFIHPTQAEIISTILILIGCYLAFLYKPKKEITN